MGNPYPLWGLFAVLILLLASQVFGDKSARFIHECAYYRPLTECEIDAKGLYP